MEKVRNLVWVGIILNIIITASMWHFSLLYKDITDELSLDEREILYMAMRIVKPFTLSIAIQIVSIPLLFKTPRLGLILAILGSIITFPFSLFF